ncbi:MAG: hypothetical protein K6C05_02420 [Anaerovibrio sp.]|uniref:hypothetical protein n=1 Tax=Anaerovibrio sp. TaxID=1872532 RepID=UPI0025E6C3E5|nr:hypothetical protein [Anaerovibrio sp.]MCR5175684.1 hypothetical protein [Anaerovibrio sp.]
MAYLVTANKKPSIEFAPDSVVSEVLQNVQTILTTIKGEIPLDRSFGINGKVVDMPMPRAKAVWSNEIFNQVKKYEPRAKIERITFDGEITGKLIPTVEVTISETG